MTNPWGPGGPPLEAYSRITDAARFQHLHDAVLDLLQSLKALFNITWAEGFGLDPELETAQLSRPTIRLTPIAPASASIVVAFTSFPGLRVRCGRWLIDRFPACGCDACAETAEREAERLRDLVDNVTRGQFWESISLPLIGAAWYEYELGSPWHGRGRKRLKRSSARALLGNGPRIFDWEPWR